MNLTVSTRIISSFAILMVFTAALLTTGLWGITHINLGVNNLTNKAIPLTINIDHMSTGLLQAKVDLMDYQNTLKSSEAMSLEQKFTQEKNITLNAKATLLKLASDNKDLLAIMEEIDSLSTSVYSMSDALIIEHNNVISMTERSAKLNRQSIDAMDNTISKATDIQVAVTGAQREQVAAFIGELEKLSASIKKAMDNSIPAAIVGLRMQSKSKLNQLDKTIISIGSMGDAAKNQQLLQAYQNFKEVTFNDSGLLNNQVELLRLKKKNSEEFLKLNEKLLKTSQALKSAEKFIVALAETIATDAEDTVSSSRTVLISAGLIALISSMLIATAVIRSIIKPLDTIVSVVTEIASGDLTKTFNDTQHDEFGHLSKNLNKLVSNLRTIIQELNNNSQHLSATAQQTSVASRTTFNNIHHQKEQTDMIAAAVEEMAATVDEVAKSAANTLKEVELAHTKVKQGEKVITDNISSITTLAQDIEHSAEVIEKLNQRSNDIGSVLDVIRSVAEQTNLLALNAAIEAARAGEQGRGFAVVADEVRTLASRAQQSTAEIQEMILQLQTGANHAVETMNNSRKQAQLRVESIAGAGKVLESISASVTTIKDMSYQIATASEEQSSTTREQNRNIVAIVDAAEKTAITAQENQKASENLAYMANEQLKMIQHFKI